MSTLQELRNALDERLERMRKLQFDKMVAPPDRKDIIQVDIDAVTLEISRLDTAVQEMIAARRRY